MTVTDKLNQILVLCASNKISFNFTKEGETNIINYIEIPEKTLNVNIGDFEDKNLLKYLDQEYIKLKNLFE